MPTDHVVVRVSGALSSSLLFELPRTLSLYSYSPNSANYYTTKYSTMSCLPVSPIYIRLPYCY